MFVFLLKNVLAGFRREQSLRQGLSTLGSPNLGQEEYRKRKVRQEIIGINLWELDNIPGHRKPHNRCKHSAGWDAADEFIPATVTVVTVLPPFDLFPLVQVCIIGNWALYASGLYDLFLWWPLWCQTQASSYDVKWKSLSRIQIFVTPWTVACQTPLSMEFSRPEYWNG